jgi:Methyltransferase domain
MLSAQTTDRGLKDKALIGLNGGMRASPGRDLPSSRRKRAIPLLVWAARQLLGFLRLPSAVRRFYFLALATAVRTRDYGTLGYVTYPDELASVLTLARGRRRIIELGTGAAWTAIALALTDEHSQVITYDIRQQANRERYLGLVKPAVRARIHIREGPGANGPAEPTSVGLLYIDSSHEREETIASFRAWEEAIEPGGVVAFHDYANPRWPGVTDAVAELGLVGDRPAPVLFVWRKPG